MNRLVSVFLTTMTLTACGSSSSSTESNDALSQADQQRRARIAAMRGKADTQPVQTTDVCEYYALYDDGVCDIECQREDPDCMRGNSDNDGLTWLCEFEMEGPNQICLNVCGDADPDCIGQADPDPEARTCPETVDHADGQCERACFPQDDDCIAEDDTCKDDLKYGDGTCDEACGFPDPDCDPTLVNAADLTAEEMRICSRLPSDDDQRLDLATSVCNGRPAAQLPACVASCAQQGVSP